MHQLLMLKFTSRTKTY